MIPSTRTPAGDYKAVWIADWIKVQFPMFFALAEWHFAERHED